MLHDLIILFKISNSLLLSILCFMINFLTPVCNWLLTWIHYMHFYLNLVTFQEFSRFPFARLPVVLAYWAYSCRLQYVNYVWRWRFDVFTCSSCSLICLYWMLKNSKASFSTQLKFWVQLLLPLNLFNRSVVMQVVRMYFLYQSLRIGVQIFMFADVVMQSIVKQ